MLEFKIKLDDCQTKRTFSKVERVPPPPDAQPLKPDDSTMSPTHAVPKNIFFHALK